MNQAHQETQSEFHTVQIQDGDNLKKYIHVKSRFAQETLSEESNNSALMKCSMHIVQTKKTEGYTQQILKDSSNVGQNQSANIVKIKPKNRTSSLLASQKNNQNSVQSVQPLQPQNKTKRPTNIRKIPSQDIENDSNIIKKFTTTKAILAPRIFLIKPVPQKEVTRCKIFRRSNLLNHQLQFYLQKQRKQLIHFQRQFHLMYNKINIKLPFDPNQKSEKSSEIFTEKVFDNQIGWLQSNFKGSLFNVYQTDSHNKNDQIVATIQYFSDVGKIGGPRKLRLYLRDRTLTTYIGNLGKKQNLKDFHQKKPSDSTVQCLQTLPSTFDCQRDMYVLNINGKCKSKPSIHNIVLTNKQLQPVLKFYKTGQHQYELQCFHPMTPFIGCAFVYSSFVFKWASQ